jgi:hypothetical protein
MTTSKTNNRQQTGNQMSAVCLVAGVSGFFYQFMVDGTFLTFIVCLVAILGMVENKKIFDEREYQLLLHSYGSAFIYLFAAVTIIYLFEMFAGYLHFGAEMFNLINSHWVGIMASAMCIFIGIAGLRNFREIR